MSSGSRPRWRGRRRDDVGLDMRAVAQHGAATARFRSLAEIARISWSPGPQPFLVSLAEAAREALGAASVSLSAWEPEHGRVRTLVNVGVLGPGEVVQPDDELYTLDDYGPLGMLLEAHIGWVTDVDSGAPDDQSVRLLRELDKHSGISVPIPGQGRVWGELYATRTADQEVLTTDDLEFAVAVGAQVGAALVTAEHLRRVEGQLHLDPLTGLAGRRHVDERLDTALASWHSERVPLTLVMVDVDGLQELTTTDGRSSADQVVRRCAALVSAAASRVGGTAGRYDWDRFCVVASGATADDTVAAAEQLVREARRLLPVPVACGVAATDDVVGPVASRERLVRLVEAAQSRARQAGGVVPVVAGRKLPVLAQVAASAAELPGVSAGEPVRVDGLEVSRVQSTERLLRLCLNALEQSGDAVPDRLATMASLLCQHLDGVGWWVSRAYDDVVETVEFARNRLTPAMLKRLDTWDDTSYRLADYPATAAVVRGGWLAVEVDDPGADPSELAMLDGMGATVLLAAGGPDRSGDGWLVEIYGDAMSRPWSETLTVLRALTARALCTAGATSTG